jgi:hypothetical protein
MLGVGVGRLMLDAVTVDCVKDNVSALTRRVLSSSS